MNRVINSLFKGKWLVIFTALVLYMGLSASYASAGAPYAPVFNYNNNLTVLDNTGALIGGTNDVLFTWDGTLKTSVAVSAQISNATISTGTITAICSSTTPTTLKSVHDVAVYGPGIYTVYTKCAKGKPGCGLIDGTHPAVTFTVGADEIGVHMLVDLGSSVTGTNADVVNVWKMSSVFTPSTMNASTGGCGSNSASQVWDLMSRPSSTTPTINGYPMVDGPYAGDYFNFNMMGAPINRVVDTSNNNFTMNDSPTHSFGGTNDIRFTWDGTLRTSVAASGQVSNSTVSSSCPFFGYQWWSHDMVIYAPGIYSVNPCCLAGSPGCNLTCVDNKSNPILPYTFTVNAGEIGAHMLFKWSVNENIDVVDIWKKGTFAQGESQLCINAGVGTPPVFWTGACGTGDSTKVWDWMSYDWYTVNTGSTTQCQNGAPMVDGPFIGMHANFNVMGTQCDVYNINPSFCDDNDACTTDGCNTATGLCTHTPITCNDNNACTTDTCNTATGLCIYTNNSSSCDDGNACTTNDTCSGGVCVGGPALTCDDNNACTTDTCNTATGCVNTPIVCNDNNACTTDTCNTATGCVYTPIVCNDNDACTADTCNTATGCVYTPIVCNDNDACTADTCNTATGCVYTPIVCNDNNACTTDTCNTATGCVYTPIVCNDNNACTTDTCNTATGCVYTPINVAVVCNDNNPCTTDTCNTATGCAFTPKVCQTNYYCDTANGNCIPGIPCPNGNSDCNDNNLCTTDTCNTATGICNPSTPKDCNDNNACTTDTCNTATGACVNTPISCDDNNICTTDTCNTATGCVHTATVPAQCDDNNICTTDGCTANACTHTATVPAQCNDNDACTTDGCTANACTHTALVCNDNNACTTDTCSTATGCVYTAINVAVVCDDNNICTTDTCNTATGCVHTATVPAQCNDNNACTTDGCTANACTHTTLSCNDNNACTTDSCNTSTGCVHAAIDCNDNNPNTTDTCDPILGCIHTEGDGNIVSPPGVDLADALFALQASAKIVTPTASELSHGDVAPCVNGVSKPDGVIDIGDVIVILRKALGLPTCI